MVEAKYPNVTVQLSGMDGNAFAILARIQKEMRRNKISREEINTFVEEATSWDYDNLLQTCMKWVNVE